MSLFNWSSFSDSVHGESDCSVCSGFISRENVLLKWEVLGSKAKLELWWSGSALISITLGDDTSVSYGSMETTFLASLLSRLAIFSPLASHISPLVFFPALSPLVSRLSPFPTHYHLSWFASRIFPRITTEAWRRHFSPLDFRVSHCCLLLSPLALFPRIIVSRVSPLSLSRALSPFSLASRLSCLASRL